MILYNPQARISFPQYGISIPSLPTRAQKTVEALLSYKPFRDTREKWLKSDIPFTIDKTDLIRAHKKEYIDALYDERLEEKLLAAYELVDEQGHYNRYDPQSAQKPLVNIIKDVNKVIAGTYQTIRTALDNGFCFYLGGGMHHAHPAFGHGFCLLNDISVALLKAQSEGLFTSAWIIDVDAHRGDGTAEIMATHGEITTFSIHMASGWPLDSPQTKDDGSLNPAWFPGDVDIPIESGEENEYIPRLMQALKKQEAEKGLPDLFFVVGGVDPYEKDELASTDPLNLTRDQMLERDQTLYRYFKEKGIASAWVAAGGYGRYSWEVHADFLSWVLREREELI